jgi:hypothetical protein
MFYPYLAACFAAVLCLCTLAYKGCDNNPQNSNGNVKATPAPTASPSVGTGTSTPEQVSEVRRASESVYGITVDSIQDSAAIVESIKGINDSLPKRPDGRSPVVTRIVLDYEQALTEDYVNRVAAIHAISDVMLLVADSHDLYKFKSAEEYQNRLRDCVEKLGQNVDIWEIGNEVNGEWAAYPRNADETDDQFDKRLYKKKLPKKKNEELEPIRLKVRDSIEAGFKALEGKTIALTLYFNDDTPDGKPDGCDYPGNYCWPDICRDGVNYGHEYEMLAWLNKYFVPTDRKPNYLLVSYYGDDHNDCSDIKMDAAKWEGIFNKLHGLYPDAKLGIGEIGAQCNKCKTSRNCCKKDKSYYISTYYGPIDKHLKGTVGNYVGGYFYWYFLQDMVPNTRPELAELIRAIKSPSR